LYRFFHYELIFLLQFKYLDYFNFKIDTSFSNKNLYVDSNFFLTSNALFGIEKFSDVSIPWLVDYEDSGWGPDFDIQNQLEQIIEKERKFIVNEVTLDNSPHLENSNIKSGSLFSRLIKAKQRFLMYFDILDSYLNSIVDLTNIWKKNYKYKIEVRNNDNKLIIRNIFKTSNENKNVSFYVSYNNNSILYNSNFFKKKIKHFLPKINLTNDFVLPKKNNITNENFYKIGNIVDRKQAVYRKLINKIPNVEQTFNIKSRLPDISTSSNYIFERQLQEKRSIEMSIKEYIKNRAFKRFSYYYFKNNLFLDKKIIHFKYFEKLRPKKLEDIIKNNKKFISYNYKNLIKQNFKYKKRDLNLEQILKFWSNRRNFHNYIGPRSSEFTFFKNNEKTIISFLNSQSIYDYSMELLLNNYKLGIGMYTYQSLESAPWDCKHELFNEIFLKLISERSKKNIIIWFEKKNKNNFYNNLKYFIDYNFKNYDENQKKQIMIEIANTSLNLWFDFENRNLVLDFSDLFILSIYELLIKNCKYTKILNYRLLTDYSNVISKLMLKYLFINEYSKCNYYKFKHNIKKNSWNFNHLNNKKTEIDAKFNLGYYYFNKIKLKNLFLIKKYQSVEYNYKPNLENEIFKSWKPRYIYNFKITIPLPVFAYNYNLNFFYKFYKDYLYFLETKLFGKCNTLLNVNKNYIINSNKFISLNYFNNIYTIIFFSSEYFYILKNNFFLSLTSLYNYLLYIKLNIILFFNFFLISPTPYFLSSIYLNFIKFFIYLFCIFCNSNKYFNLLVLYFNNKTDYNYFSFW